MQLYHTLCTFGAGGRVVEGARLERVYTFIAYRGFESLSVRTSQPIEQYGGSLPAEEIGHYFKTSKHQALNKNIPT